MMSRSEGEGVSNFVTECDTRGEGVSVNVTSCKGIHSQLSRRNTNRGSCTSPVTVGPTKE